MCEDKRKDEWSPKKKWGMDLLKTLVVFAIITCVSYLMLPDLDDTLRRQQYHSQKYYDLHLDAYKRIAESSFMHAAIAVDALDDAKDSQSSEQKASILKFEDETFDEMKFAIDLREVQFHIPHRPPDGGERPEPAAPFRALATAIDDLLENSAFMHQAIDYGKDPKNNKKPYKDFKTARADFKMARWRILAEVEHMIGKRFTE
jgi:hypothetical protein